MFFLFQSNEVSEITYWYCVLSTALFCQASVLLHMGSLKLIWPKSFNLKLLTTKCISSVLSGGFIFDFLLHNRYFLEGSVEGRLGQSDREKHSSLPHSSAYILEDLS